MWLQHAKGAIFSLISVNGREVWREGIANAEGTASTRRGSGALEERELIYEKLPKDIAERHVLLMVGWLQTFSAVVVQLQLPAVSNACSVNDLGLLSSMLGPRSRI